MSYESDPKIAKAAIPPSPSSVATADAEAEAEAPPRYTDVAGAPDVDVTASFAELSLTPSDGTEGPQVDTCLAHLKLLHAINALKEDVGYTEGLWGLWDSHADHHKDILEGAETLPHEIGIDMLNEKEKKKITLSRIREKRWALFIARAVDRYEAWWNALPKTMLSEMDMATERSTKYTDFAIQGTPIVWEEHMLPPLDVLMVMHSHMLNPQDFLEDSIRNGLNGYWTAGLPWQLINSAIATDFTYNPTPDAQKFWTSQTGRSWENQDDPMTKTIKCPWCKSKFDVPWTTCGTDETSKDDKSLELVGKGYGDGKFTQSCPNCYRTNNKELLSVAKFIHDSTQLLTYSVPMPGTVLDPKNGRPELITELPKNSLVFPRTFPNRMIHQELRIKIMELIDPTSTDSQPPSMETVRNLIEKTTTNEQAVRRIDFSTTRFGRYTMRPESRVATRKMMSRYWENFSPFALDLCGAVMRQGVFIDKMVKLDWLHSPSAKDTMGRLIKKYKRFITIMERNPFRMVVPTLDVDLAWHTHQLSPHDYYAYTVKKTGKFIDHDDKIEENKLSDAFEWTTKTYQDMYGEIYSECTCWYCETIRTSQSSRLSRLLRVSQGDKLADSFHDSGAARLCPPANSAHISAHNSVKSLETPERAKVADYFRARQKMKLENAYQKAAKRAEKKGRKLPPRDEYYDHWGYSYYMYGPFMYPLYITPGIYYGWDPCQVTAGAGAWANCAAGTCGGAAAVAIAGGCGGAGGCGHAFVGGCGASDFGGTCGAGGAGCGGGCGGGGCGGGGCGSGS